MPSSGLGLLELVFIFVLALAWGVAEWRSLRPKKRREPPPDPDGPRP